ncbi:MAG: diacylglycerol kinase [Erysipelotrichaceae bacterium]
MIKKFKPAFIGLVQGIKDPSILTQYLLGLLCIVVCFILKLNYIEWCLILLCIALVISCEYLNTAIERLADFVETNKNEKIKYIKDISAAAVLVQAIVSVSIFMIILHHIWKG